jgi:hypothetical protein
MVTDTGEVLSGSTTNLTIGKNALTNNSTEKSNLDSGSNVAMNASYLGTGGGHNVGTIGQQGVVNRGSVEFTNLRNEEASTERRELQSHSTQLAQMYNLFQGFHLGTNRALFMLEPRPHIRQADVSFINGPRALEGIQEVFLTVVRPKQMQDFCVGVMLETAHLSKKPKSGPPEYEEKTVVFDEFRVLATAVPTVDQTPQDKIPPEDKPVLREFISQPIAMSKTYYAPEGWIIVDDLPDQGKHVLRASRANGPFLTFIPTMLTISGSVTWRYYITSHNQVHDIEIAHDNHLEDGFLDVDVDIHLRSKEAKAKEEVRKLFFAATHLCCCEKHPLINIADDPSITYSVDLRPYEIYQGFSNSQALGQSRQLAADIRKEMVRSLGSPRRRKFGEQGYLQSDVFFARVADVLRARGASPDLLLPVGLSAVVPSEVAAQLQPAFGGTALGDVLATDASTVALRLGVSTEQVISLKEQTLRAIGGQIQQVLNGPTTASQPGSSD